jgi:hypothetical protein
MKTTIFFVAALAFASARVCSAQTPSPTPAESNWQLAPPFEKTPATSPARSTPAPSTPAPTQGAPPSAAIETPPPPPPPTTTRGQSIRSRKNNPSYVEGPVWVMSFIKTKSGLSDEYLKSMTGSLKPVLEEEKRQRIILDYKILSGDAASDRDFNIIIMTQYPNMAALDGLREKTEPIIDKIIGPTDERRDMAAKRLDIREILATKTMREIWLR